MFSWFKKNITQEEEKENLIPNNSNNLVENMIENTNIVNVDIHSHLLYGIDDGAKTIEDTLELAKNFVEMGYKKMVFTPHIMFDRYKNTPEIILNRLEDVKNALAQNNINLEVEAAAEYYLDEGFVKKMRENQPLLCFGKQKYVLFESGFSNKPRGLKEVVFDLLSSGYKPIWAHPERYYYLHKDEALLEDMLSRGVLLQINQISLVNYYGEECRKYAEFLIDKKYVSFIGSDCHSLRYVSAMKELKTQKIYQKLSELKLLNDSLLDNDE